MTIDNIDVEKTVQSVRSLLEREKHLSPALKAALEVLLMLVAALLNRLNLNSRNSSKPPSTDPNRPRNTKAGSPRKPGGQKGHVGTTLKPVPEPDEIRLLEIDRRALPKGCYRDAGYEARQVFDLDISRVVTEYRAQVLVDEQGNRFVATFPEGVSRPAQYGNAIKAHAVYLSQFQLLPYARIEEYFREQLEIPISSGSLSNFNQQAGQRLATSFEPWVKQQLIDSPLVHVDETGINIDGKRHWLHCTSNDRLTLFFAHPKRGTEAMDAMGVLPHFHNHLCHDHWKPYYRYDCTHALCNAHHLRELERAREQDGQQWAGQMLDLLIEINRATHDAGGQLDQATSERYRTRYRERLLAADTECPPPDESLRRHPKGRQKRSKSRNLLERLRAFEEDVLRFMDVPFVPFTNNRGENDIRMTKVHQKISGCFRSMDGASTFCRVRSYLSTCRKQNVSSSEALRVLFEGDVPEFMRDAPKGAE